MSVLRAFPFYIRVLRFELWDDGRLLSRLSWGLGSVEDYDGLIFLFVFPMEDGLISIETSGIGVVQSDTLLKSRILIRTTLVIPMSMKSGSQSGLIPG